MSKYRKFSDEYRVEAVRMVIDTSWPIAKVARDLGINAGRWETGWPNIVPITSDELTVDERARLKGLERENRELRLERDFLRNAAAFFAKEQQ